jgi:hypothetical protein
LTSTSDPVDRDAGAHEVEVLLGRGEGGRRVGQVAHVGAQAGTGRDVQGFAEHPGLPGVGLVVGRVGVGEVRPDAHDPDQPVRLGLGRRLDDIGPVARGRAAPGQTGVDLEVHPGRLADRPGRFGDLPDRPDGTRRQVDVGHDRVAESLPRTHQPGEQPRAGDAGGPQCERLTEQGSPEPGRTTGKGGAGARHQAVTVTVGLDDRHHLGATGRPRSQHGDVVADRGQVDPRSGMQA